MKLRWLCGMAIVAAMGSCTKTLMIKTGSAVNPGPDGKATSVQILVFPLRGTAAFQQAGAALVEQPSAALGSDLVGEPMKIVLQGSMEITLSDLSSDVKYIGLAAVFQQAGDDWKAVVPLEEVNKKVFFINEFKVSVLAR